MTIYRQIPNMSPALALAGNEELEIVQSGVSVRTGINQVGNYLYSRLPPPAIVAGPIPPQAPVVGQLWFYSEDSEGGGALYVYYFDGQSAQWIAASPVL